MSNNKNNIPERLSEDTYADDYEITYDDVPVASSDMDIDMDEEGIIDLKDVVEIVDDTESIGHNDEAITENGAEKDDASFVFTAHSRSVFCCTLSKNGKVAATGAEEDKAYLWDTVSGEIVLECRGHVDSVVYTRFNSEESYLASGDMSGTVQVWKVADKSCIWTCDVGDLNWMEWHSAANILFTGCLDGQVYMWKIPSGQCKVIQGYGCSVETASLLPDGKHIAVGYGDGTIKVFDLKTNTVVSSIPSNMGHTSTVTALDCHVDNNLILSAAVDGKTILSTPHTGKIVSVLQNLSNDTNNKDMMVEEETTGTSSENNRQGNWVEAVAFCKDTGLQLAATGTVSGEIFIWDVAKQALRQTINLESGVSKLLWKGNTSLLFSAGLDGVLRCFDARNSQCVRTFVGHTADILDLCISGDGRTALTCSDDSTARVFDISSLP